LSSIYTVFKAPVVFRRGRSHICTQVDMGVCKGSIGKILKGNRFHVKVRILFPYSNVILFES